MTRADGIWLAMTSWLVRIVHWSGNSQCVSHSAALWHNLSRQDSEVFSTTCWGQKEIWLKLSRLWALIQQIRVSCTSKQTRITQQPKLTSRLHFTCSTDREKNNRNAATRQQAGRNNLIRHGSQDKLDYTSRFVRVIPTFSQQNSFGHGVVGVNMVEMGCSSQHPASKRLSWDETFCTRSCEHHPPTIRSLHRRTPEVSQLLPFSDSSNSDRCSRTLETFWVSSLGNITHHSC